MKEKDMLQIIKGQGFLIIFHGNNNGITVCDECFYLVFDNVEQAYRFLILYIV